MSEQIIVAVVFVQLETTPHLVRDFEVAGDCNLFINRITDIDSFRLIKQ